MFWLTIAVYVRGAGALLTATIVPILPALLAAQALLVVQSLDGTVTEGALIPSGEPRAAGIWLAGAAGVLALIGAPVATGAGILVGGCAMLGQRVPVGAAWRRSLRRYPAVLGWAVQVSLLSVITAAAIVYPLLLLELPPVLGVSVGVFLGLLAIMLYVPVIMSLPVALIADTGLGEARHTARRLRRFRSSVHTVFVLLALGVSWGSGRGLVWAAEGLPLLNPAFAQVTVVAYLGPMLLWPWVLLLLCAPLLHAPFATVGSGTTLAYPDLDRVAQRLPRATGPARTRPARTAAVALAVLLLPPLIAPVTAWANPYGTPAVTTTPVEPHYSMTDSASATMRADGSATLIAVTSHTAVYEGECDPECEDPLRLVGSEFHGEVDHAEVGDHLVAADWHPEGDAANGLRLWACEWPCDDSPHGYPSEYPFAAEEGVTAEHLALAPLDDGLVLVAGLHTDPDGPTEGPGASGLTLWACADVWCEDHQATDLPGVPLWWGGTLWDGGKQPETLDVATGADGMIALTALHSVSNELTLVMCADADCQDPVVRQLVEPDLDRTAPVDGQRPFGSQVEFRPDGTPVVAYRSDEDGSARLIDCGDSSCSTWEERVLTGPGYSQPVPDLAVDSAGLPQIVTFNETDGYETETGQLVLVSCQDPGCAESTTLPLAALSEAPAFNSLALDPEDVPHILWAQDDPDSSYPRVTPELLRCHAPACGAQR